MIFYQWTGCNIGVRWGSWKRKWKVLYSILGYNGVIEIMDKRMETKSNAKRHAGDVLKCRLHFWAHPWKFCNNNNNASNNNHKNNNLGGPPTL